jgi:hypothetical protein
MTIRFETYGIREAVAELRNYDRTMYEEIIKDLKQKGQPLVSKVAEAFPMQPFRRKSNWRTVGRSRNGFPPYDGAKVRAGVQPQISTQKSQSASGQTGIYRLIQKDGGGAVYDGAGRRTSNQFTTNLDKPYSTKSSSGKLRSRVMYGTMLANMNLVQEIIDETISKTNKIVQDNILRNVA